MNIPLILQMAADGYGERVAVAGDRDITYTELLASARGLAGYLSDAGVGALASLAPNSSATPVALFGAAEAGVPYVPLNYRLTVDRLQGQIDRFDPAALLVDTQAEAASEWTAARQVTPDEVLGLRGDDAGFADPDAPAVLLHTSGTTAEPKVAILRHRHLWAYVLNRVEFDSAAEDEATLVSLPPYHVSGVANVVSSVYAGRRVVMLDRFSAEGWLEAIERESVTHALVVPTMVARIVDHLEERDEYAPDCFRYLAYGGGRMPRPVIERALERFPEADFANAYGLTETSSTLCLLGPDEHRAAREGDPRAVERLGSVGPPLPAVELEIREDGEVVGPGVTGEIWVRGEQVSGEYQGQADPGPAEAETGPAEEEDDWFDTRDRGSLDADGYLYLEGRTDETIIRGGENIAPAEVEDVILRHPDVADAVAFGVPDDEWGARLVLAVVLVPGAEPTELEVSAWIREQSRASRTPDQIVFRDKLPYTDTGKIVRREVQASVT